MVLLSKGVVRSTVCLEKAYEEPCARHVSPESGSEAVGTMPNAQMAVEETACWVKQFTRCC